MQIYKMKWIARHFTLPILLGLSLTSVSIALIYVLYKKDEEDTKSKNVDVIIPRRIKLEYKVPRQFVPAVIGRGGSVVKDVQNKTGTKIYFDEDNIECPVRVCIIQGSYEGVHLAAEMIKSIIENQPIIETYEMYVPQSACGWIIGRGGEVIKQIQLSSRAKIIVESSYASCDPNGEGRIIIKGTADQIAAALIQIEDKVHKEKEARTKVTASATRIPRTKSSPHSTPVNTSEHSQTNSLSLQVTDGMMEVYISAIENPSQFWVQVLGPGIAALDELVSEMTIYYNNEQNHELHTLKNITIGQVVAAKFSCNEKWCRAEVVSTPKDGQCEVYFVDYGDREMVQLDQVLELRTDFLSLRLQAIECSLANIKPRGNEWSSEACHKFADLTWLTEWNAFIAKVRGYKERVLGCGRSRREGSPIPCVDLFDPSQDINIGQELINAGFAEPEETLSSAASSTLSLSARSHEIASVSRPVSTSPLATPVLSPETPINTPCKMDSAIDSPNTSVIDLDASESIPLRSSVEEINLVTPQALRSGVEEIDLVTPVKEETSRFIANEKQVHREDGGGDHLRNGTRGGYRNFQRSDLKISNFSRVAPAGYESDLSGDSDELELG